MNMKVVKPFLSYVETPGEVRLSYKCRFLFGRLTGFMRPKSQGEGTEGAAERGADILGSRRREVKKPGGG